MRSRITAAHPHHNRHWHATMIAAVAVIALVAAGCSSTRPGAAPPATGLAATTSTTVSATAVAGVVVSSTLPTDNPATTLAASTTTVAPTTTPPPPTDPPTTVTVAPTTTTNPIVTEGAVVLVANATKVNSGGAKMSKLLGDLGFHMATPTNGAGSEEVVSVTHIYVLPGGEAVAQSLAIVFGGVAVAKMPVPAPITLATAGLGDATVLVMLGKDFAGHRLPKR